MEKFEELKSRVSSELKVQKQWESCALTTGKSATVGALVGLFAAMVLFPRRPSLRSAVLGMGVGVGIGRGATLCSQDFTKLQIANSQAPKADN